jgi:ApaG protein
MTLFYRMTEGIRITVYPSYVPAQSDPDAARFVFSYRIRIENVGPKAAQLVWRHWYIHDPVAGDQEVSGEGVIGQKPVIQPGGVHEYSSFCVLQGPEGSMEGSYEFLRAGGVSFRAAIPRFLLRMDSIQA